MGFRFKRRAFLANAIFAAAPAAFAAAARKAPPFEAASLIGRRFRLEDYKGKNLVLVFWATWCPHCRRYLDVMQQLHKEYAAKNVEMLALSVDETGWKVVAPYIRDHELTLPIALASPAAQRGYDTSGGIPLTAIIDGKGNRIRQFTGAPNAQQLRGLLDALVKNG